MYDTILIPTDGSDDSRPAIDHGLALADRLGASVHGLSVVPEGPHSAMKRDEMRAEPDDEARHAVALVEEAAANTTLEYTTEVRTGVPQEVIVAYAKEIEADIIVMGTAGRSGLENVILGSVAEEVVQNSPMPVLTVGSGEV